MVHASFLDMSFATCLTTITWCVLPIYGACLGLALPFLAKTPSFNTYKSWAQEKLAGNAPLNTMLIFHFSVLFVMASYRGYGQTFFQGQLLLTSAAAKFIFFILSFLGLALAVATIFNGINAKVGLTQTPIWALGPSMAVMWGLLPLTTQLSSALLVLELLGVLLIWALTTTSTTTANPQRLSTAAPGFVYALIIFIWASGLSALMLLLGLGLTTLEGFSFNFFGGLHIETAASFIKLNEALFTFVLLFKFLMGSGQFLLLTWYRFLPMEALTFYLFFYYPAQLLIGTTFFVGYFLNALTLSAAVLLTIIFIAALSLMANLGSQTSPALTLAGSSFIGLSFLAMALLNLPL